jgi:hypothetical protein
MQPQSLMPKRTAQHDAGFPTHAGVWLRLIKPTEMSAEIDGMHFEVHFIDPSILAVIQHNGRGAFSEPLFQYRFSKTLCTPRF